MLTGLLYPLGRLLQWLLAITLLLLAWWLQQQLLTAYTEAWLAGGGALLLVSGKSLAILYTATSTGNHPSTSARPLHWLRRLLLTLSWLGTVSVIARYLERAGPGRVWLLDWVIFHTAHYPAYPPYSIILLGCAALLALLLELAQVVILQRLAQVYLPLLQIEQEYRLRRYQHRLEARHQLDLARLDEQGWRQQLQAERERLEQQLRQATRATADKLAE